MTPEEVRELWELCGFETFPSGWYRYPNKAFYPKLPLITLDNLFKWAVPKLTRWEMGNRKDGVIYAIVSTKGARFPKEAIAETAKESLAQACLQALRGRLA